MSVKVDVKELLETGAHFGHKTSRWHPKMAPYIHSVKGGVHIIDLVQTTELLEEAIVVVEKAASAGKQVLFVGTKRQSRPVVKAAAEAAGQPYVVERWLGGMLTNSETMSARVKHLKSLEEKMESGELVQRFNKLEVQRFQEEIDRLNHLFGGVKDMKGKPGLVFVTDVVTDHIAVKEAIRLNIPVIAIVDTNGDPTPIDYPVPCNDDAIAAVALVSDYLVQAIAEGKKNPVKVKKPVEKKEEEDRPSAKKPAKEDKTEKNPAKKEAKPEGKEKK